MKHSIVAILLCFFACQIGFGQTVASHKNTNSKAMELKTMQDSVGYAIGMDIGKNLKSQNIELNPEALAKGLADVYGGKTPQLTEEQSKAVIAAFQKEMQSRQEKERVAAQEVNKKKGEDFLAKNKTKPGVITLANGLQYEVIKEGTGRQPMLTDKVTTHYHGTLIDGTVFDSSVERGEPATFPVNGVIQAWQIMLPMMKEGGKVRIYSPSELAYGSGGAPGGKIGPNSVLIFEIELIKVL